MANYRFPVGFNVTSQSKIDDRLVLTKTQMLLVGTDESEYLVPDPYFALCSDDNRLYIYSSSNTRNATTGYYRLATKEEAEAITALQTGKQDKLTAGTNITIEDNVISAVGGGQDYTAGEGIDITSNVISVKVNDGPIKTELDKKQNTISDLETIKSGAAAGATAVQPAALNDYAKKTEIPTVPTKVSELTNDAGYLTQHQDISGKANVGDSYTKAESDAKYLTEHQSLDGYATETWVEGKGYLTQHQDISGKANVGDSYTKAESDGKYLTEHQSLDGYATKTELNGKQDANVHITELIEKLNEWMVTTSPEAGSISVVKTPDSSISPSSWTYRFALTSGGSGPDLSNYVQKGQGVSLLDNDAGYTTTSQLNGKQDKNVNLTDYATKMATWKAAGSTGILSLVKHQDSSSKPATYVLELTEGGGGDLSKYATKEFVAATYLTKTDGATKTELNNKQNANAYLSEYATDMAYWRAGKKTGNLAIVKHQDSSTTAEKYSLELVEGGGGDLSKYVQKTELNTILSNYASKSDLDGKQNSNYYLTQYANNMGYWIRNNKSGNLALVEHTDVSSGAKTYTLELVSGGSGDLSKYVLKTELNTTLSNYASKSDLNGKQDYSYELTDIATKVKSWINSKQTGNISIIKSDSSALGYTVGLTQGGSGPVDCYTKSEIDAKFTILQAQLEAMVDKNTSSGGSTSGGSTGGTSTNPSDSSWG